MKNKVFEIPVKEIYEESLKSCIGICELQVETARGKKLLQKCLETRDRFCKDCSVKIVITPFPSECVKDDSFRIEDKVIYYHELGKMAPSNIIGGYMYVVYVEALNYEKMSPLQMYYADCWMSAYVEATWNSMKSLLIEETRKDFLEEEYEGKIEVSESYAPGFGGMQIESVGDIFELMKLQDFGMELHEKQMIIPSKSIIGIYVAFI